MSRISNHKAFQNSTINALIEGDYEGNISFKDLKKHGNFGLGTFHNLDGEMIGFDGMFYQIKSDGSIKTVSDEQRSPFSIVTNFCTNTEINLTNKGDYNSIKKFINQQLPSLNYIYAFRIDGTFSNVITRSVPPQEAPIRLVDVMPNQRIFAYKEVIKGVMVGFYFPAFMQHINVTGFHFHFLSEDKTKGGHVLNFNTETVTLKIQQITEFQIILPQTYKFANTNLMRSTEDELNTIERNISTKKSFKQNT